MRISLFVASLCLLIFSFFSCGVDYPPGTYHIELRDSTFNLGGNYPQVYWKLKDSAAWEKTMNAADSVFSEQGHLKIRSNSIWYEFWEDSIGLRARQPYPGWERAFDTLPSHINLLYTENRERVLIDIPSANVLLGNDSVRIGIIHVTGRAFDWQNFPLNYPDYLIISLPGQLQSSIVLGQENIGPISRQTVFRIGRRKYALKFVSDDRREIVVEELPYDQDLPITAELDLTYKQVQVKTLDGEETYLKRPRGKDLAIYFFSQWDKGERVKKIDSLYRSMPPDKRDEIEIALVSRYDTPEAIRTFIDTSGVSLPIYLTTAKTCLRLNCRPNSHYFVGINERGKITTYFGYHEKLVERLGGASPVVK